MGCLSRLTAPSYVGVFGKKSKNSETNGQAWPRSVCGVRCAQSERTEVLSGEAYNVIRKDFGTEKERYFKGVAKCMINGDDIHVAPYSPVKTGFLGLFD